MMLEEDSARVTRSASAISILRPIEATQAGTGTHHGQSAANAHIRVHFRPSCGSAHPHTLNSDNTPFSSRSRNPLSAFLAYSRVHSHILFLHPRECPPRDRSRHQPHTLIGLRSASTRSRMMKKSLWKTYWLALNNRKTVNVSLNSSTSSGMVL